MKPQKILSLLLPAMMCVMLAVPARGQHAEAVTHPLDPLTATEMKILKACLEKQPRLQGALFTWAQLVEPSKEAGRAFRPGMTIQRRAEVVAVSPANRTSYEVRVDLNSTNVESIQDLGNLQPSLVNQEFEIARDVVNHSSEVRAALERRGYKLAGLTNLSDRFFLDVYAPGKDARLHKDNKTTRAIRVLFADRQGGINSYGPYVEGLMALVDLYQQKLIALDDYSGAIARKTVPQDVFDEKVLAPAMNRVTRPAAPPVPNLHRDGHHLQWENWDFRFSFNQREGLTLHQISFNDHGKLRSICHRASISEMLVPYSDPSPGWLWREFFDSGEYGLGYVSTQTTAGKDLPADALTLDVCLPDQTLSPTTYTNRIFFYERDGGLLYDHTHEDGSHLYARANELVVGFVVTVGNYDYVYKWVFREDGVFAFEAELNGLVLNKTVDATSCQVCQEERETPAEARSPNANGNEQFGTLVSPQVLAVFHQHWINLRMDFDIDGITNAIREVNTFPLPPAPKANARQRAFGIRRTVFQTEADAMRNCNPDSNRAWIIYNPGEKSALDHFPGYCVQPAGNTSACISEERFGEETSFVQRHFWATKYHPGELYAAGKYPNQAGADYRDTLFHYAANRENLYGEDVVIWYSLGFTHVTEPEDFPIMPAAQVMVRFVPSAFFERSPALGYIHIDHAEK